LVLGLDLRIIDVDGVAPAGMGTARPIYLVRTRHPVPHLLATAAVPDVGLVEPTSSGGQAADALASLLEEVPRVRAQVDQALARATQDQRSRLAVALATYNDFAGLARAELGLSGAGGPADPGDAAGLRARALALAAGFVAAQARLRGYVGAVLGPQAAGNAASAPQTRAMPSTSATTTLPLPGAGLLGPGVTPVYTSAYQEAYLLWEGSLEELWENFPGRPAEGLCGCRRRSRGCRPARTWSRSGCRPPRRSTRRARPGDGQEPAPGPGRAVRRAARLSDTRLTDHALSALAVPVRPTARDRGIDRGGARGCGRVVRKRRRHGHRHVRVRHIDGEWRVATGIGQSLCGNRG
jgi:hypothetical protein